MAALAAAHPGVERRIGLVAIDGHDLDPGHLEVEAEVVDVGAPPGHRQRIEVGPAPAASRQATVPTHLPTHPSLSTINERRRASTASDVPAACTALNRTISSRVRSSRTP
jgi:hypothetical protein